MRDTKSVQRRALQKSVDPQADAGANANAGAGDHASAGGSGGSDASTGASGAGATAGSWDADAGLMSAMGLGGEAESGAAEGEEAGEAAKRKKRAQNGAGSSGADAAAEAVGGQEAAQGADGEGAEAERDEAADVQARNIQRRAREGGTEGIHEAAQHGVSGSGQALPHQSAIQASFGSHDVSGIQAHVGGEAAVASEAIGAEAYATGNNVAFRESPDLFTAAHEAAHVVQQRQGVSLLGGVGEAGDVHEQHADAVASLVVQGRSAESLLGAGSGGGSGGGAVQRWQMGERKKNRETSAVVWPAYTEVGIETPPDIIMSQYKGTYTPTVYFNIDNGWNDRGDLEVVLNGAVPKRWAISNKEDEWQTPSDATITKPLLTDPGPADPKAKGKATLFADYDAATFDHSVDCKSPEQTIQSYHSAFVETQVVGNVATQLDISNAQSIAGGAGIISSFSEEWTQSTAITNSASQGAGYGKTLSKESKTGISGEVGGSVGGHEGAKGATAKLGFSQEWTDSESNAYTSDSQSSWNHAMGTERKINVSYTPPKFFKGNIILYPFTSKRSDKVKGRKHDGEGKLRNESEGFEERWINYNIPAGSLAVLGADPAWLTAVDKKLGEAEGLYDECMKIERQYTKEKNPDKKEKLAEKLTEAKKKLKKALAELAAIPYNDAAARTNADKAAKQIGAPAAGASVTPQVPQDVDALAVKMDPFDMWTKYASEGVK